jgi:ankyrin repeat protein
LATAAWHGHENIVRLLLLQGADINAEDRRYDFALRAALSNGQENIAQLLIENGADVNLLESEFKEMDKEMTAEDIGYALKLSNNGKATGIDAE